MKTFLLTVCAALVLLLPPGRAAESAPGRAPWALTAEQRARLDRALAPLHAAYDPAAMMLRAPLASPGYHTTLTNGPVHSTRAALEYAVALLDTGDPELLPRACGILRTVIALQDQAPASRTYGIWPWFLEEPLVRMAPPDWNWADFCGVQLLQVALDHRARLPPELATQVDEAIRHAARSIQRRNVGPDYTNIALMGTYVTFVAAELYGWADLQAYAAARLRRFYDYTREQGAFTEYNSPTYSMVAVAELGRMRLHVRDAAARPLIEELYALAWEDIAQHFHAPTHQWAGPHSRCYSTLLSADTLARLQRATGGRAHLGADVPALDEARLPLPCPPRLIPCFQRLDGPRQLVKTYLRGAHPVVGTTWLEPGFALGSVNRGELWNQRRALVAYWGTAARPAYLHVRCLRDGYDFADAQFFAAQKWGDVLAAVNFATDGGNTHIGLDRIKGGVFPAQALRLRFAFGGAAAAPPPAAPATLAAVAAVRCGEVGLAIAVPYCRFGAARPVWEAGHSRDRAWLDVVLHAGPRREFHLQEIETAAIGFAVRMTNGDAFAPDVRSTAGGGRLTLAWDQLKLSIPVRPAAVGVLQAGATY